MTEDRWQQAVIEAMERLVGAEHGAQVAAEWDAHVARGKVEVTFLGPYSSGKSTLLRRLVVEGNGDVPEWLTVSARRETFELNTVDVGDLTFTDAPGFAAGNDLHDALAQEALVLSDAFLLVLPPQLLTTNRELVASIVSGEYFFGTPVPGSDRAVIAVIAQADSMGPDPEDDVDEMRRLAERKRSELIAQLESAAGVPLPNLQVFCVAADPYEEQARRSHPDKRDFDPYRAWDGIAPLTAALDALTVRQTALRRSAGSRYFCRVAGEVASQAQAVLDELHASADEMRARQTDWEQQKARVDALISAAEANLHSVLISLASELSEEIGGDATKSRSQVDDRMTITLENWAQRWDGELDLVLGEAKAHVDDRLGRVRALRTEDFLRSLTVETDSTEAPRGSSRIVDLLNKINGDFQDTARKALEFYADAPIERLLDVSERSKAIPPSEPLMRRRMPAPRASRALALSPPLSRWWRVFWPSRRSSTLNVANTMLTCSEDAPARMPASGSRTTPRQPATRSSTGRPACPAGGLAPIRPLISFESSSSSPATTLRSTTSSRRWPLDNASSPTSAGSSRRRRSSRLPSVECCGTQAPLADGAPSSREAAVCSAVHAVERSLVGTTARSAVTPLEGRAQWRCP